MKFRTLLPFAVLLALAVAAGLYAGYRVFSPRHAPRPQTAAVLLHEPKPLPDFALTDTDGKPFTRASLAGHWNLLYFGYTHCPDACPTTLSDLAHMRERLGSVPAEHKPQVWFISIDPKRDDPALLKNYTLYFDPSFMGATGSVEALRAMTAPLGVDFTYSPADQKGDYGVTHSTFVVLVDPEGEEVALFSPPEEPARMAADYLAILAYYGVQP
jgi:protein SCO1/2